MRSLGWDYSLLSIYNIPYCRTLQVVSNSFVTALSIGFSRQEHWSVHTKEELWSGNGVRTQEGCQLRGLAWFIYSQSQRHPSKPQSRGQAWERILSALRSWSQAGSLRLPASRLWDNIFATVPGHSLVCCCSFRKLTISQKKYEMGFLVYFHMCLVLSFAEGSLDFIA